jgi:hypothetical protein
LRGMSYPGQEARNATTPTGLRQTAAIHQRRNPVGVFSFCSVAPG